MASTSDSDSTFFFPFAPVPSSSNGSLLSSAAGATPTSTQQPFTGTFAGKRLSCLTCRKGKAKCIWIEGVDSCSLCLKRALVCPGSTAPQRRSKPAENRTQSSSSPPADVVDWGALGSSAASSPTSTNSIHSPPTATAHSLIPYSNSSPTSARPFSPPSFSYSPYHTSAGLPRVLGPSSSEGSLNALARAHILKGELVTLYQTLWPLQLPNWPVNSFSEFLDNRGADPASRVMASIAAAGGARSSAHSEVVGLAGPSLREVDEDQVGQFLPGGFSQWGLRRHGPAVALAQKAIQEVITLLQRDPSPRNLKVALAGVTLYNGLYNDRRVMRPFLLMAIETWRRIRANAMTTAEDRDWLLAKAGPVLLMRDCYYPINVGDALAFTDEECSDIFATFEDTALVECFGVPAITMDESLIVFPETLIFHSFYHTELPLLHSIVHVFGNGDKRVLFGTLAAANLAALQAIVDGMKTPLLERLATLIEKVNKSRVFVLHDWTGSWRPDCMKDHAIIILNELLLDLGELDFHIFGRLQLERSARRIDLDDATAAEVVQTARERCRAALKFSAQSIERLLPSRRRHATWAGMYHHLVATVGWVDLALGRFGDPGGPLTKETELTVDEIEWLLRAFRVGSYSQSALVTPLRELEAGWELLKRDEVARMLEEEPLDLSALLVSEGDA